MRAFHRKGFQAASMADIIAESGLSAGAIYGHFASKSEIVLEVATQLVGSRVQEVGELAQAETMSPPARLVRVLMAGMLADVGDYGMLVQLWGEAVTDDVIRTLATRVIVRLRAVYADYISLWHQREHGLDAAHADALAHEQVPLFVSAAQGFILQAGLVTDFDREAYLSSIEKYLPR
jgi:AcrR family transcriptional regulator